MTRQWLNGYQYGLVWVPPPPIAPATVANAFLTYSAPLPRQSNDYVAAATCIFSIMLITFFYMKPGIDGAAKWKVQLLCDDIRVPDKAI